MTAQASDVLLDMARDRIRKEVQGVLAVVEQLDETLPQLVDLILRLPGKVFITGSGTSGIIGRRMAHLLAVCGTPSLYIQPMDALHGTMGAISAGDLLIAISRGGASTEINELARRVKPLGVDVVSITSAPHSELAQMATISIVIENPPDVDPGNVIAMGSTLAVGAWGDALAYLLMIQRGHSWQQVLYRHPAGAVGQISELPPALENPAK